MQSLTPQHAAFIETVTDSNSIALEALAGTGKTFSLQQWGNKSARPGIATSFSKSTVGELVKKLGAKFPAKTFHAIGLTALKSGGKATKLDTSKMYNATKALSESSTTFPSSYKEKFVPSPQWQKYTVSNQTPPAPKVSPPTPLTCGPL